MSGDDRDVIDGMAAATLRWLDEHANYGVITTDRSLVVRTWNKWLATSTDQPPSRVIGKPLFEVVPSFVERGLDAHYRDALLGQSTVLSHTLHKYVIPCVRSSGEMMPQSGRIAPLVADGEVVGTITTLGDVSDRMATEKQLRAQIGVAEEARADAEAASRAKDEFLATLSHEIRTPLSAVLGWVHLLKARDPDVATIKRAIEVIERNAQSQLALINDMLDMARISSGKIRLEFAPVNMASVVAAAIETVRPAAELKSIRLVTDLPGKAVEVSGDGDRLQQIVWNLLSNAVKFTGNGGMVVVSLRADATGVHLSIADTGQGIERQFLSQVFDRFKQADTSAARRAGGLGLGLALVKELVGLHGGMVSAESPGPGFGATFSVHLPNAIAVTAAAMTPLAVTPAATTLDGVTVLIVEDDPDARDIASRTISAAGGGSLAVGNADDAIAALATSSIRLDALVSDIGLPGTDGYALLQAVRGLPNDKARIPAIAVTAYASPADAQRALRHGFVAHLSKPYVPSALVAAVRDAVER
jgi:signal transduction histidine kinase/ActR/RegA family two-component response regulator